MNKFRFSIIQITAIIVVVTYTACKKLVEVPVPRNQLTNEAVFSDSANAASAVTGLYIAMIQPFGLGFANGGLTLYPGLSADELSLPSRETTENEFLVNNIAPNNSNNQTLWQIAYSLIYQANACIEGITASVGISTDVKNRLIAEVKTVRAFCYYNLVNLYGEVPLVTGTDYQVNQRLSRSPIDELHKFIEAELLFAKSNLPKVATDPARAGYYAAIGLLAKLYLFEKNYIASLENASTLIQSGNFNLEQALQNVFITTSSETIWKLVPVVPWVQTMEGYYFVPSSPTAAPNYTLTSELIEAFEEGDNRKQEWTTGNTLSGNKYYYPYKYKKTTRSGELEEHYTLFRLAEIYLIRAEAEAALNLTSQALEDLNLIRNRAGLESLTSTDQDAILKAISQERRVELFCEWGNRWIDLKRTGRAQDVLSPLKQGFRPEDERYPIPQSEINANPNLAQNSGY